MRRAIVTHVTASHALAAAPVGYSFPPIGWELVPGRIQLGPGVVTNTTVALLDGDDGVWLKILAESNGGTYTEDGVDENSWSSNLGPMGGE